VVRFKMYVVERDEEIISQIVDTCTTFWEENVIKGVCPPNSLPAQRTLKRMRRVPTKVVDIDSELVVIYEAARKSALAARAVEKEARVCLIQALGDGEVGTYDGGRVEYYAHTKRGGKGKEDTQYRMLKVRSITDDDA